MSNGTRHNKTHFQRLLYFHPFRKGIIFQPQHINRKQLLRKLLVTIQLPPPNPGQAQKWFNRALPHKS